MTRSYYPTVVEPALLSLGKPPEHEDGSPFTMEEFKAQEVAVRPFACDIDAKMHPDVFICHYDANNKRTAPVTPTAVDFGHPSQGNAGASTSIAPSLSTPATLTPARIRPGDDGNSQPQEDAAQVVKDSSIPGSSVQGAAASAPTTSNAPAQGEDAPVEKDHPLYDFKMIMTCAACLVSGL